MPIAFTLSATKRTLTGRQVKNLRHQGLLPANVYGKGIKSLSLQLPLSDFQKVFAQAGETNLVDLKVQSETNPRPILITNVHFHPVTNQPLHADFHQVDLKEKVTAQIPVELIGEAPAVKEKDAILFQVRSEIEVEALPTDLIDKIKVNISQLSDIGASILAKDLQIDRAKLTLQIEDEEPIVIIQEKKEEEEAPAPAEAEAEVSGEETPTEDKEAKPEEKQEEKETKSASPAGKPEEKETKSESANQPKGKTN